MLVAAHQTAGRGRLDRTWEAPPGANLLASLLFRDVPADVHELTQRLALAAVDAVRVVAGIEAVLKWPNDLLVDDAKLAGVLAQTAAVGGRIDHVVVGIGLNVGWSPPGAACLGEVTTPAAVLSALLVAYDQLPVDIYPRYRAALGTIGRQVRIEATGGVTLGRAVDVDRDGRLVVIDECAISHRIDTGDVVHLRPG